MKRAEFEKATQGMSFERIAFYESTGSTNDVVADWAREGAEGLCLAAADEQTQGRGRAGRRWVTPPGSALAFSLLLDTDALFENSSMGRASGLGALAVCEAIQAGFALVPQIKWPNDVLLNGQKICGVLPEAHWIGERLQALILGIGINVAAKSVPDETALNFPATSLEQQIGHSVNAAELLRAVLERLLFWKTRLAETEFIQAWESRLAYRDQHVRLEGGEGHDVEAELVGLTGDGALRLRLSSGERVFQVGEVHLRPLARSDVK